MSPLSVHFKKWEPTVKLSSRSSRQPSSTATPVGPDPDPVLPARRPLPDPPCPKAYPPSPDESPAGEHKPEPEDVQAFRLGYNNSAKSLEALGVKGGGAFTLPNRLQL